MGDKARLVEFRASRCLPDHLPGIHGFLLLSRDNKVQTAFDVQIGLVVKKMVSAYVLI